MPFKDNRIFGRDEILRSRHVGRGKKRLMFLLQFFNVYFSSLSMTNSAINTIKSQIITKYIKIIASTIEVNERLQKI